MGKKEKKEAEVKDGDDGENEEDYWTEGSFKAEEEVRRRIQMKRLALNRDGCGRLNSGPPRSPHSNPWSSSICYLMCKETLQV